MDRLNLPASNFSDCLTIGEAAEFLGVSTATLRNWDRSGKLKPRRHPQNGYRIYLHEDLQAVLRSADLATLTAEPFAPQVNWTKMRDAEHFVQFYENDEYLVESLSDYVGAALRGADCSIVIATAEHRDQLEPKLVAVGIDVMAAKAEGRYVVRDASDSLSAFMVGGAPDPRRFQETIGRAMAELAERGRRIHAFGEMVALLWAEGNRDGAIAVEQLWNDLAKRHRFTLFCAYPIAGFANQDQAAAFDGVCSCHSRVIPAESYAGIEREDERLRAIGLLQQQAHSLKVEIEHRREVEKAFSRRERELADFFENATEGLHKVGADGTILWANKAEYSLLGYSVEEYVGHPISEFHADADVIADLLERLQRGETLVNVPVRLRCKNGTIKHVLISSNACIDEGEFLYTRCFTRDISEQWQAEKSLIEADRRKDEFLATLSHELRNPLAPLRNALELLDGNSNDLSARQEATSIIRRQMDQMTRLVDDLLDISRITRDKVDLRQEDVDLATIIHRAIETSRPAIDAARHELEVALPKGAVKLHADPARLAQVFSNLLNNAAKFTPAGGQIRIDSRNEGSDVVVSVRDNGIGISREALAYAFDMFRQADQSLEQSQGGLGISLTLVRRLVELHGGTVIAYSDGPGKGSEFSVRLPAKTAPARATKRSASAARGAPAKRRVLVVDDNHDSGNSMSMLLRAKGHDVRSARDGLEAIDVAAKFRPEIILMDVAMPKLNGYDATRRIREMPHGRDVFIVALTGWGQASDIARSKEAGCSAHIVKPVDIAALDELLATAPGDG